MKTLRFLKVHLIMFIAIIISGSGCSSSSDDSEPKPQEEAKLIPIHIGFTGEITSITESPLTKSEDPKDWYDFQVYSRIKGSEDDYSYYAYGFFDNKDDMTIILKDGYEYKFDVGMISNAEDKVHCFSLVESGWATIGNSFIITSTEHVRYLTSGYLYLNTPFDTYNRPNVDRFWGSLSDYVPEEGGTVSINMKRSSFGVKFIANDFTEGSLEINVESAPLITLDVDDGNEIQDIISFANIMAPYSDEDYYEDIPVNIIWVKGNTRLPIISETITFKRNKMTTIEFKVIESSSSSNFDLTANEELETGETYNLDNNESSTSTDVETNTNSE
jgi:hypothetical protein